METVSLMPGASHSGRCSDACSGCIDENQAPSEGVCLDAALAAREVAECLCEPKDFPDNCRGENACRVPVSEGAALAKDCVTRLFEATDTACLDCLLGVRAGKCDTAIRACDGSPAQPQPQDGG